MNNEIEFNRFEAPLEAQPDRVRGNDALSFSDEVLAQNFIDAHIGDLRYTNLRNKWFVWDGLRWLPDEKLAAYSLVRKFCYDEARVADGKEAKDIASAGTVAAIERLARADQRTAVSISEWDVDPWVLNSPSGTVDLRTGIMRPADPNDRITKVTGIAPDWKCPTPLWQGFLKTVTDGNGELIDYLQGVVGYALTGSTEEQALFFLYGTGANGKSTFINAVTACIGDYHRTAPIETFTASKNDRHPTELAGLAGARLVTSVETEEGRNWDEVKIKTLTGGDRVSARFMCGDFFEYTPAFKLLIAGNHKPTLRSVDEAIRRRFNLIPFTVTIPEEDRDPDFPEKLKAELPGIMAWMVDGCVAWQREGLQRPAVVAAATEEYLQAEDAILAWIEASCRRDVDSFATTTALFVSWSEWASKNGEAIGTAKSLQGKLETKGFLKARNMYGRGFAGLRIMPSYG